MRLINANTLEFVDYFGKPPPNIYYILSHRWGSEEISYRDFKKGRNQKAEGYSKIVSYCKFALQRHELLRSAREKSPVYIRRPFPQNDESCDDSDADILPESQHAWPPCYVWVDTCCIDKKSSAELSEAINSMYNYYSEATECHALLADVNEDLSRAQPADLDTVTSQELFAQIAQSKWFTRGWTLQELLAPKVVVFLNKQWDVIGHKRSKEPYASISHHPESDQTSTDSSNTLLASTRATSSARDQSDRLQ